MGLVGDLLVNRRIPREAFSEVREILQTPDILFGNLEGACTDKPQPVPSAPEVQDATSIAGFETLRVMLD